MPFRHDVTEEVFRFIQQYKDENQISPSIREIADGCYLGHTSVYRHLDKLEAWGWIEREPGQARSIRITKTGQRE